VDSEFQIDLFQSHEGWDMARINSISAPLVAAAAVIEKKEWTGLGAVNVERRRRCDNAH
jgi:hypothetical protein